MALTANDWSLPVFSCARGTDQRPVLEDLWLQTYILSTVSSDNYHEPRPWRAFEVNNRILKRTGNPCKEFKRSLMWSLLLCLAKILAAETWFCTNWSWLLDIVTIIGVNLMDNNYILIHTGVESTSNNLVLIKSNLISELDGIDCNCFEISTFCDLYWFVNAVSLFIYAL